MGSTHIVLVDDDPRVLEVLVKKLSRPGVTVHAVADGDELASLVADKEPSLVILDVVLPGRNGYQLCRELRGDHPDLPIFLFSGKSEPADRFWAEQVGATAFFEKPMDLRRMIDRAGELVARLAGGDGERS